MDIYSQNVSADSARQTSSIKDPEWVHVILEPQERDRTESLGLSGTQGAWHADDR